MKRYQEELSSLSFDEESRQRMMQRLRAAQQKTRRIPSLKRLAAAGAAAAMCIITGAACATSLAGSSPAFREFFNITDEQQEQKIGASALDLTFADRNGSGTRITVRDVTNDRDRLYIIMELEAPENMVLPEADTHYYLSDGTDFYLREPQDGCEYQLYTDNTFKKRIFSGGSSFISLPDSDPTDNRLPMLYTIYGNGEGFPETAYIKLIDYDALYLKKDTTEVDGDEVILENLDFEIVLPIANTTPVYEFEGRQKTLLNGVAPALIENLAISPYSVSFDVVIADLEQYEQAFEPYSPWEIEVVLNDGTRISGQYQLGFGHSEYAWSEQAQARFCSYARAHVLLNEPMDLSQLHDIRFGDSSEFTDGAQFDPYYFKNELFWNRVKEYCKKDIEEYWRGI